MAPTRRTRWLAAGAVVLAGGALAACGKGVPRTYPQALAVDSTLPLDGLRDRDHWPERFNTQGHVVLRNPCPPCPEGAMCEPCAPESVLLSPHPEIRERYPAAPHEVVVYVNRPEQLELGGHYRVTLAHHAECWSRHCPDFEILGYTAVD